MDYETVSEFPGPAVMRLVRTIPSRFAAKTGGGNRIGEIFVDYLRNGHGAIAAAAFCTRGRPGLGVSMPISRDQLEAAASGSPCTIDDGVLYASLRSANIPRAAISPHSDRRENADSVGIDAVADGGMITPFTTCEIGTDVLAASSTSPP